LRAAASIESGESLNPKIREARELSLSLLKPSARDLARGLELHADALVVDAYGFAPRAAVDGLKFKEAVEAGASEAELVDLREDMSMTRWATDAAERNEFLDAMRAAGVTCIFQNAGEEGSDPLRLIKRLARFTYATDLDELRMIRIFYQLGIRMMHLTYNRRNPIGDGAGEPGNGGLSDFGHAVVAELNRCGVIVDVAHSGWRTSLEAARASQKPMVASHSACGGLYSHFRAKPDEVVKAICDTDGYIGICVIPRFLGGDGDILSFLNQIDYAVKKFGAEHVAIGTDVAHVSANEEVQRAKIPKRTTPNPKAALGSERWEHLWPEDHFVPKPHAEKSLAWTNWPLFTVGMVQRGHKEEDIRKVLGKNVLRVLSANQIS
jgi:membrane dipeptidase